MELILICSLPVALQKIGWKGTKFFGHLIFHTRSKLARGSLPDLLNLGCLRGYRDVLCPCGDERVHPGGDQRGVRGCESAPVQRTAAERETGSAEGTKRSSVDGVLYKQFSGNGVQIAANSGTVMQSQLCCMYAGLGHHQHLHTTASFFAFFVSRPTYQSFSSL